MSIVLRYAPADMAMVKASEKTCLDRYPQTTICKPVIGFIHVHFFVHKVKEQLILNGHAKCVVIWCSLEHISAKAISVEIGSVWDTWGVGCQKAVNFLSQKWCCSCRVQGWSGAYSSAHWCWRHWHWSFLCVLPRHTSPMITHPRSSHMDKSTLWGPLHCSWTSCSWIKSHPRRSKIDASGSKAGILFAMHLRRGWRLVISGNGCSDLSSGSISHSIRAGKGLWVLPSNGSTMKLMARHPAVSTTPEHVFSFDTFKEFKEFSSS